MELQRASSHKKLSLPALKRLPLLAMLRLLQICCNSCISKSSMKLPRLAPIRLPQSRQWALVPLLLPVRPVGKLLAPAAPAAMQWMTRQQIYMFQMAWQGSLAPLGRAAARSTQGTAKLRVIRSTTGAAGLLTGPTQSPLLACICVQACDQTASSPTGSTQMSSLAVCAPANCKTLGEGTPRAAALELRRGKLHMQKVILIEFHAHQ